MEEGDDRSDVGVVGTGVQASLEEAPVPVFRRRREEQHEHVATGEGAADLAPPVRPRGDVVPGDEAGDGLPVETLDQVLYALRQRVIVVLVADEHHELLVADVHRFVLPSKLRTSPAQ
jgi:hypothetical protein